MPPDHRARDAPLARARAVIVEAAVAAEPGRAELHFVGTESTASLRADWPWLANGAPASAVRARQVEVTTLDALIAAHGRPDYIKIDVEGFELECLRGLSQPVPLVSFEYHLDELALLEACLDRLATLSDVHANVIPMNGDRFMGALWIEPAHFMRRARAGLLPPVGDVFVMADGAAGHDRLAPHTPAP